MELTGLEKRRIKQISSLLQFGYLCTIMLVIFMRLLLVLVFVGDNQPTGLSLVR